MMRKKERKKILILCITLLFFSSNYNPFSIAKNQTNISGNNNNVALNDGQNHYAIIIGIEEYKHNINTKRNTIDETATDVYLQLKSGVHWKKENIRLLLNENATKNNIKNTLINWLDPLEEKNDIVLFYFIGKTQKTKNINPFNAHTISYCYDSTDTTEHYDKITDKELDTWIDELESKHIGFILDTSYANKMKTLKQNGRVILASTGSLFSRTNPTDSSVPHTLFSHYVIKGLIGYADENGDGIISLQELFFYAKTQSFHHSIESMITALKQSDFRFHPQLPSFTNRHFGVFYFYTLPFGWKQITDDGFGKKSNYATRGMTIFNGELYIGTQNNLIPQKPSMKEENEFFAMNALTLDFYELFGDLTTFPLRIAMHVMTFISQGCEIWKYNFTTDSLKKVVGKNSISNIPSGFGSHFNAAAAIMHVYKDYLYVGTWNTPVGSLKGFDRKGCEIWRSNDGLHWEQVVGHNSPYTQGGFGNPDNTGAWSIETFQDYLYVGTMNWDFSDTGGCEIWRSNDGLHWEQVVEHGFRVFMNESSLEKEAINTYAWDMEEYQGHLYMGTFNARLWLNDEQGTGCQLWRTPDGTTWDKVLLPNGVDNGFHDGFGEGENYGIRRMVVYNGELYCGIASSFFHDHGCEIWRYDGVNWTPVISDEIEGIPKNNPHYDGFGNPMNKYIWSMVVTNDNKLWVGTNNVQLYIPIIYKGAKINDYFTAETEGCEIWCYDGKKWQPVIKNDIGLKPNGLGDKTNLGARSMIEYPKNSGNLIVGTFKFLNSIPDQSREGCELWMRYTT